MDSNGEADYQSREKWRFRDVTDGSSKPTQYSGYRKLNKLYLNQEREELNDDIAFWHGSYLGQQLIAMLNWTFTIKRTLLKENPIPIKSHRVPPFTTRSYILSSWCNGRELLEQARRFRIVILYDLMDQKKQLKLLADNHLDKNDLDNFNKYVSDSFQEYQEKHEKYHPNSGSLEIEDCHYIISAKAVHHFYKVLQYTRILVDNNQAIIIPPTAFVVFNLWRTLFRLVEVETFKLQKIHRETDYEKCRNLVRSKLMNYVSKEIPTSNLDVDYASSEAIRQLREISTMDDLSSLSSFNILHNKYFLNNDFEDPGFHLDWTLLQMVIPSALMSIKWIEKDMESIKIGYQGEVNKKFSFYWC